MVQVVEIQVDWTLIDKHTETLPFKYFVLTHYVSYMYVFWHYI